MRSISFVLFSLAVIGAGIFGIFAFHSQMPTDKRSASVTESGAISRQADDSNVPKTSVLTTDTSKPMPLSAGNGEPSPQKDFLKFKDGRLSTNIRDRPLSQVAQALIEQAAVNVRIADSLRNARISAQILDQPLEQGLRDLFRQYDAFFFNEGSDTAISPDSNSVSAVWVYPKGKGKRLAPVSPEEWASLGEATQLAHDADPDNRITALENLIRRRGREALAQVQEAMDDKDDRVRYRTLDTALKSGVIPPVESLEKLTFNDRSDIVRFLALDGLATQYQASQPETVKRIAEQALADANPRIQSHAQDILTAMEPQTPTGPEGQYPAHGRQSDTTTGNPPSQP